MRWSWFLTVLVTGCVRLNAEYQDTAGATGDPDEPGSTTASATSPIDDASGVTSTDPADDTSGGLVTTDAQTATSGLFTTSSGDETTTEASPSCEIITDGVDDDAFLVSCGKGCSNDNYGATEDRAVANGEVTSQLLLRVPVESDLSERLELTIWVRSGALSGTGTYDITAYPIDPRCVWDEGDGLGDPVPKGTDAVTFSACNGNPAAQVQWDPKLGVLADVAADWAPATQQVDLNGLDATDPTSVALKMLRANPGPLPGAILVTAVPQMATADLIVSASESFYPPEVAAIEECM